MSCKTNQHLKRFKGEQDHAQSLSVVDVAPVGAGLAALVIVAGPARGQAGSSSSSAQDQSKDTEPVVRTFGAEGGFRTEVTSRTKGTA